MVRKAKHKSTNRGVTRPTPGSRGHEHHRHGSRESHRESSGGREQEARQQPSFAPASAHTSMDMQQRLEMLRMHHRQTLWIPRTR